MKHHWFMRLLKEVEDNEQVFFCQHSLLESWKGFTKVFSNETSSGGASGKEPAC